MPVPNKSPKPAALLHSNCKRLISFLIISIRSLLERCPFPLRQNMHFLRFLMLGLTCVLGSLAVAWAAGALYFDLPAPAPLRTVAAIVWALAATVLGLFGGYRGRLTLLVGVLLVAGWWSTLRPRLDRDWQPQVALLAYATRDRID
jgi:hypothetical protein